MIVTLFVTDEGWEELTKISQQLTNGHLLFQKLSHLLAYNIEIEIPVTIKTHTCGCGCVFPRVRMQVAKKNSGVTRINPYGLLEAFWYIYVLSSHYKGSISLNPGETKADTKPELIEVEWFQNFKKKKSKLNQWLFFGNFWVI